MGNSDALRLPVVSASAEYLAMGHLMRRNILAYKAPENNEGYDIICIHPDPRHIPHGGEIAQVRVQVKSRFQTDCDRAVPLKTAAIDAFDFLIVVFLNIGAFYKGRDGSSGFAEPEFYTLTPEFVRQHHYAPRSGFDKLPLKQLQAEIEPYKNEPGFELIAEKLGIPRPTRQTLDDAEG